jgi:hypothetical protein
VKTYHVDRHGATVKLERVQDLHGSVGILGTDHGDEGEATGLASVRIIHDLNLLDLDIISAK